jgi:superfamily II DNA/RNA helicase
MSDCIFYQSAGNLWNDLDFQKHYKCLVVSNVKSNLVNDFILEDCLDFSSLIRAASIFSLVKHTEKDSDKFHEAAFRISYISRKFLNDKSESINNLSAIILSRLGNFPTIKKQFSDDNLVGYLDRVITTLPSSLALETLARYEGNTVLLKKDNSDNSVLELTDFQRKLWESLNNQYNLLSFSSPTSSGKTFILQNFLVEKVNHSTKKFLAIYLVPTRALISEVSYSLRELFKQGDNLDVRVLSLSVDNEDELPNKVIYVFTQERLLSFLSNHGPEKLHFVDIVMVDEAHQIAERARGTLLHQALNWLNNSYNIGKFIFCSPVISNPELFESLLCQHSNFSSESHMTTLSPVAQNLLVVSSIRGITNGLKVELHDGSNGRLCIHDNFELSTRRTATSKAYFLAYCAYNLGKGKRNIIYVDGPSKADSVASELIKFIKNKKSTGEIDELSSYIKKAIHKEYVLAESLKYRIGIHYGKMPSLVRDTVERLFREEKLDFIICTSTLAQGVNLPAQNLFILDPKVQDTDTKIHEQIDKSAFWNIVGRAGRLYKDFEGNVFLLKQPSNADNWEDTYLNGEKLSSVIPATQVVISGDSSLLIEHLTDPEKNANKGIEETASYVYDLANSERGIKKELQRIPNLDVVIIDELSSAINEVKEKITISKDIVKANVGISPVRQQALFNFLTNQKELSHWILPRSLSDSDGFHRIITKVLGLIDSPNMDSDSLNGYGWAFTIPALSWMKGTPLNQMISEYLSYKRKKKYQNNKLSSKQINNEIRNLFGDIESNVRFKLVKYVNCYNNLSIEACKKRGEENLIELIPTHLSLFLEVGVSNSIQLSLVSLGLSRITAIEISGKFKNKDYSEPYELIPELKGILINNVNLPRACIEEIKRVVD